MMNERDLRTGFRHSLGAVLATLLLTLMALKPAEALLDSRKQPIDRESTTDERAFEAAEVTSPTWNEVDRLIESQRYRAAERQVGELLEQAIERGETGEWTRALIRLVQLQTALHGYETAVRTLEEREWPAGDFERALVRLFYAQGLVTYARAYSWEIRSREPTVSDEEVDLERMTLAQIGAHADRAYFEVWSRRASLGGRSIADVAEYLAPNNYPPRIRSTLRDAVTYLWVEQLVDTSLWQPSELNERFRLDLENLLAIESDLDVEESLMSEGIHPLRRISILLEDLARWHAANGRVEAAAQARIEKLERLHASFDREDDRRQIVRALADFLGRLDRGPEWWSVGQAELAGMVAQSSAADALIRARELAREGLQAHPDSLGGRLCRALVDRIEAPDYSLTSMRTDGPGRRSIEVRHKNLDRLHFRAYSIDVDHRIDSTRDYDLLPGYREVPEILAGRSAAESWTADLAPTADFRFHRTFVVPPVRQPGLYLIVASSSGRFDTPPSPETEMQALYLQITDLVLLTREAKGGLEAEVRSGDTGQALGGVDVELYRYDYQRGHRLVSRTQTTAEGRARFRVAERRRVGYFLLARSGDELVLDPTQQRVRPRRSPTEKAASLIYTDRTVYRPEQEILWKVVAYEGVASEGRYRTLTDHRIEISLLDVNGETIASQETTTNEFGSASGSFDIPAGRLLGAWRLNSSLGGQASIRVEEYERPRFEVELVDPPPGQRLNRPVELSGEARYYFGLPVSAGEARWTVERTPRYPHWWYWRYPGAPVTAAQWVASGGAELDPLGAFSFSFLPQADERDAAVPGIAYDYRIRVEVVDEGGETRSAERTIRLGFVSVAATIEAEAAFFTGGSVGRLTVRRTDLDGVPRAGTGTWSLFELQQPATTLLPAEQPLPEPSREELPYSTPGDRLRTRWQPNYDPRRVLTMWAEGGRLTTGELDHDESGLAEIELRNLEPGAYRLRYRTRDDDGNEYETEHDFVVTGEDGLPLALPAYLEVEQPSVGVGQTARILVYSGLCDAAYEVELFRHGTVLRRESVAGEAAGTVLEIPVDESLRGGFGVRMTLLRDHQLITLTRSVMVPWDDRRLAIAFTSFRDHLRPGSREIWRVEVEGHDGETLAAASAELLAYMYDRSLDLFAPHSPPRIETIYPTAIRFSRLASSLGDSRPVWSESNRSRRSVPHLHGDRLRFFDGYPIGGPGRGGKADLVYSIRSSSSAETPETSALLDQGVVSESRAVEESAGDGQPSAASESALRTDFSETAFWEPHLVLDESGSVAFEFTVPDSVTEWSVWVHALTGDLRGGALEQRTRSIKELMIRPYLPRFVREGDRAELRVAIDNAGERLLDGKLDLEIRDRVSGNSLLGDFGLAAEETLAVPFRVAPGETEVVSFVVDVPPKPGDVVVEARGRAGDLGDGEAHVLPVLPGRLYLSQSRFAALHGRDRRELSFAQLSSYEDPTRRDEQLVVTLDAQLFYGVLTALPYLIDYPYECTEQTLNRFVSTGIVSTLFDAYPAVAAMAKVFAERDTRLETWDRDDPNHRMALEETPWLVSARGGSEAPSELIKVLDPEIARVERRTSIARLEQMQTASGGFPWFPGGSPSPYMTLYLLHGLSRAMEFDVEVPQSLVTDAWRYLHRHYVAEIADRLPAADCCWERVTFLNYVLSVYPDPSWTGGVFSAEDRDSMLDFSFRHWKEHSPLLKSYLALTLARADRISDARLVFGSVLDAAKSSPDEGVYWAPEERSWLWYNDRIETHAFALRTLLELDPDDERRHGLVQWLFLNKKLNHWKSTRATAEVIYALVHYLEREGALGAAEHARVRFAEREHEFDFAPDRFTGFESQLVFDETEISQAVTSRQTSVWVESESPGFLFASATWHFSTDRLPQEAVGDLFSVERRYFLRRAGADGYELEPLRSGSAIGVGDQIEVQLSIRARSEAEYVHLRDPRGAGFEPESIRSGHRWELGLAWYEETRDSGTNFFFERIPKGEFTVRYRLRASMAGRFRVGPTTMQSMYAPEFTGYSSGATLEIER